MKVLPQHADLTLKPMHNLLEDLCAMYDNEALYLFAAGALMPMYGIALNPSLSGAAMAVSSIAVLMNSLLLRTSQAGKVESFQGRRQDSNIGKGEALRRSPQA